MSKKTIFIVDPDKKHTKRLLSLVSANFEVEVKEFESALPVLHLLNEEQPSLIILELNLPIVNGLSTLNYIRENEKFKTLPVIICTNDYTTESRSVADELGHSGIFYYPFEDKDILQSIYSALEAGVYIKPPPPEITIRKKEAKAIAVLDDDEVIRMLFDTIITSKLKYHFIGLDDSVTALEQLQNGDVNPDLLILDMNMPQMDGITFLRSLKEKGENTSLPVIACTAETGATTVSEFIKLGVVDFLAKPFDNETAAQKIMHALNIKVM